MKKVDIYKMAEKEGLDAPLTKEERRGIERMLDYHSKKSATYFALVRLLAAERKASRQLDN